MKLAILFCLFGLIACDSGNVSSAETLSGKASGISPQRELVKVEGSHVSFRISTFVGISCRDYNKQFSSATPINITDKVKLAAIDGRLKKLQPDAHHYEIDTRAKVIFIYDDATSDTLCVSQFNSYYKGHLVAKDMTLNQLLGI